VRGCTARPYDAAVSISRLWLFLGVALPVLAALLGSMSTVDLTYHLRAGRGILETGALPSVDTWTFTVIGRPWLDQQWGAQVALATADRLGGWTGVAILRAILTGVIFGCVVSMARRAGLDPRRAALLALGAFLVAAPAMAMRPQLMGMALFAVILWIVTDRRRHPGRLWLVPVLVTLWANVHGSFFLGVGVLVLAWLEDLYDRVPSHPRTFLVLILAALTACATPFGPGVWAYGVGLSTNPGVTARITEWQATSIRDGTGLLFFASALGVGAVLARRGRSTPWPTLLWLGVFFAIGAAVQRGVAWWPLAAVPAVAGVLVASSPAIQRTERTGSPRINMVVAGGLVLVAIVLLPVWRPLDPRSGVPLAVLAEAPAGITAALGEVVEPGDRVFNPQSWGSWFEYAVPEALVALDSRLELFPEDAVRAYDLVATGSEGWESQLRSWAVRYVVVQSRDIGFARRLEAAGWEPVYGDADGTLYGADSVTSPRDTSGRSFEGLSPWPLRAEAWR
jgi:hypothetical protein